MAGATFTAHTLYSGIFATRSRALTVRKLAAASLKWKVMKTDPAEDLSVIWAFATTLPLRDSTCILTASSGSISTFPSGWSSLSLADLLLTVPVWNGTSAPAVVIAEGYILSDFDAGLDLHTCPLYVLYIEVKYFPGQSKFRHGSQSR